MNILHSLTHMDGVSLTVHAEDIQDEKAEQVTSSHLHEQLDNKSLAVLNLLSELLLELFSYEAIPNSFLIILKEKMDRIPYRSLDDNVMLDGEDVALSRLSDSYNFWKRVKK